MVIAPFVPSGWITLFSACGVLSLEADESQMSALQKARQVTVAPADRWRERVPLRVDGQAIELGWGATPEERKWAVSGGSPRPGQAG